MLKPEAYALSQCFYALSLLLEAPPGGAVHGRGTIFNFHPKSLSLRLMPYAEGFMP
jgi:hypothetical protein